MESVQERFLFRYYGNRLYTLVDGKTAFNGCQPVGVSNLPNQILFTNEMDSILAGRVFTEYGLLVGIEHHVDWDTVKQLLDWILPHLWKTLEFDGGDLFWTNILHCYFGANSNVGLEIARHIQVWPPVTALLLRYRYTFWNHQKIDVVLFAYGGGYGGFFEHIANNSHPFIIELIHGGERRRILYTIWMLKRISIPLPIIRYCIVPLLRNDVWELANKKEWI